MRGRLVVILLATVACARFNTFYNAQRAFRDATALAARRPPGSPPTPQEVSLLDRCIQKCAIVVGRYAESGLADDAIFLMAEALAAKEEFAAAAQKYEELRRYFPHSPLVGRSLHREAAARSRLSQFEIADVLLEQYLTAARWDRDHQWAGLLYVSVAQQRGDCTEAIRRAHEVLGRVKDSEVVARVHMVRGRCLLQLQRVGEAVEAFGEAEERAPNRHLRFAARLARGEALAALGEASQALEVFEQLGKAARADSEVAYVGYSKGLAYRVMGEWDRAEQAWRDVIAVYGQTTAARRARMALARMLEQDRGDLGAALVEYEELAKQGTPRDLVEEAGRRAKALRDIERLRQALVDSAPPPLTHLLRLAEAYLLGLDLKDSAYVVYTRASSLFPDSAQVSRALYAAGLIALERADTAASESLWNLLVQRFPHSSHAKAVEARRGVVPRDEVMSTPEGLYLRGERAWLDRRDPRGALEAFSALVESFPSSPQAPQALVAMAWVSAHGLGDTAKARAYLTEAALRYPGTEPGLWAASALRAHAPAVLSDEPPSVVRIDTVDCEEVRPSGSGGRLGVVLVKVLVDTLGKASRVELVRGTGSLLCDDAALAAARMAEYASGRSLGVPVEAWLEVSVPFRPTGTDTSGF